MTPFDLGAEDARLNAAFAPEMYFASRTQMCGYAQGFLSVKPDNEAAKSFLATLARPAAQRPTPYAVSRLKRHAWEQWCALQRVWLNDVYPWSVRQRAAHNMPKVMRRYNALSGQHTAVIRNVGEPVQGDA